MTSSRDDTEAARDVRRVDKVFAYVTHRERLLVFRHPRSPEAGIQVPAGTVEPGEPARDAALRETREETGLPGLFVRTSLGSAEFDMAPFGRRELQRRHFFHLGVRGEPPETWRHEERFAAHGADRPLFEFFWVTLSNGGPDLIAGHGAFLARLVARGLGRRIVGSRDRGAR